MWLWADGWDSGGSVSLWAHFLGLLPDMVPPLSNLNYIYNYIYNYNYNYYKNTLFIAIGLAWIGPTIGRCALMAQSDSEKKNLMTFIIIEIK